MSTQESDARRTDGSRGRTRASETDTRLPRQFAATLIQYWRRDAELLGTDPGAGALLALAGEAADTATADPDRAEQLWTASVAHGDADPRAYAGLRRIARRRGDGVALTASYEMEHRRARSPQQRLLAGVGLLERMLVEARAEATLIEFCEEIEALSTLVPEELRALLGAVHEDVLVATGRPVDALQRRARRWNEIPLHGHAALAVGRDRAAQAVALLAEFAGVDEDVRLQWWQTAWDLRPTPNAARPLLRATWDRVDHAAAENLLQEMCNQIDDPRERARRWYELGMTRATLGKDLAGGLSALLESAAGPHGSPAAAVTFLALARGAQGNVVATDFVDALGTSLDFAAGGVERADVLTQMALRLDRELDNVEGAIELAREALQEVPGYPPAVRVLGRILQRLGRFAELTELGESELDAIDDPAELRRAHERLAELYIDHRNDPAAAERHLRAALELGWGASSVRRLAGLLEGQHRWEQLVELLVLAHQSLPGPFDRLWALEQAAHLAELRLRDPQMAIAMHRRLLGLAEQHPMSLAALERLFRQTEGWRDLLSVYQGQLEAAGEDRVARIGIWCRIAETAEQSLGDVAVAEEAWRRALEEDPGCDEALRGLGAVLGSQERWRELAEMTEREVESAPSVAHRRRALRRLGELYAVHLDDHKRAVACFLELVASEGPGLEEALLWLERLHQAAGDSRSHVQILRRRLERARHDQSSHARLSFRVAELLEWRLNRPSEAFAAYLDALGDRAAAELVIPALDRLWRTPALDDSARRHAALRVWEHLRNTPDDDALAGWYCLVERGWSVFDEGEREDLLQGCLRRWPDNLQFAERVALRRLAGLDAHGAVVARHPVSVGVTERWRAHRLSLDLGLDRSLCEGLQPQATPTLASVLALEDGSLDATFEGSRERATFQRIGRQSLTLAALRAVDDSETGLRLGILAADALQDRALLDGCWDALTDQLDHPLRAMRAWLDRADDEFATREERVQWLRHAARCGGYSTPLREELYTAQAALVDLEGLAHAVGEHLAQGGIPSEQASALSLRRGRALEQLGRRDEAIEALRYSAVFNPGEASVALEKARLEMLADRLDDARMTLEGCLDAGPPPAGRLELLVRLAELCQMEGGSRPRAIEALEEAWTVSEHQREQGLRLAHAHGNFGDAARCVELMTTLLARPPQADDLRHWLLLSRVQAWSLKQVAEGESVLWMLFDAFPDRRAPLDGLQDHFRRSQDARAFARGLLQRLSEPAPNLKPARRTELWIYVGELLLTVLQSPREAEAAFRNAIVDEQPAAMLLLRLARAIGAQPDRGRDAASRLLAALAAPDADLRVWEESAAMLETVYTETQDAPRLRYARHLRLTLGAPITLQEDRIRRDPDVTFEPALTWERLGGDLFSDSDRHVMPAMMPLAEKVFSGRVTRPAGAQRMRPENFRDFDAFLQSGCRWLGVQPPRVTVFEDDVPARVFDASHFGVAASRIAGDDALRARFWAGWMAGLQFMGAGPMTWLAEEEWHALVRAVAIRQLNLEVAPSTLDDAVSGLLLINARRTAAAALRDHPQLAQDTREDRIHAVFHLADRAGLLLCGDLRTAVGELAFDMGQTEEPTRPHVRDFYIGTPRLAALMRYAQSDAWHMLRHQCGLSSRPWVDG